MSINVQEIIMRVKVDTSEGINKLGLLEEAYQKLSKAQKETKDKGEKSSIGSEMQSVTDQIKAQREQMGLEGLTVKQLRTLQREYAQGWQTTFTEGTEGFKKARADYDAVSTRLKELTRNQDAYDTQLKETVKTQGIEALSVKHLQEYYKLLKREIEDTSDFESVANKKRIAEAKQVDGLITSKTAQIKGTQTMMQQVFGSLPSAIAGGIGGGVAVAGMTALQEIPQIINRAIDSYAELTDVQSDIKIALQKTDQEVDKLNQDLKKIDTRTSNKQLRELAIIAGDLNEVDVTAFVETMDKASIVFGRDFPNVEELATTFGKIKGFFTETKGQSITEFVNSYGSAIKKLNDDGPATTKGIIEFTTRVGSIPDVIKPAASDVLAFASVFEEAGMTAERSSSGLINVIQSAGANSAEFAKVLGMTRKEFKALYDQNPTEVIVKLAEKLKDASGSELVETLQKLKLTSKESVDVIGNMVNNLEKFKEKQKLSSSSVIEATRLQEVFNEKNTNAAAKIEKAGKVWDGWMSSIGRGMTAIFMPAIDVIAGFTSETDNLNKSFFDQQREVQQTEAKLRPLITRYYELEPTLKDNAKNQAEFNKVLSGIAGIVPDAITQVDKYGRAISINLGIVNDYINKIELAAKRAKYKGMRDGVNEINRLAGERYDLQQAINRGTKYISSNNGEGTIEKLQGDEIKRIQERMVVINKLMTDKRLRVKEYQQEQKIDPEDDKKDDKKLNPPKYNSGLGDDKAKQKADKEERERVERLKKIQTDTQKEIEIRAKLTYEADLALASAEQKQVLQAEKHAEEQTTVVKRQYQDKNGLVKEYGELTLREQKILADEETLIENEKNAKILAIRKDFAQQRELQLKEQITRSLDMFLQARTQELNIQIEKAQSKGDDSRVYVLRQQLAMENRQREANAEDSHYLEQKRKLAGNAEAIEVLEQNHVQALLNIQEKYNADADKLRTENFKSELNRYQQSELERLRLQVSAKEQTGGDALQEKLAVLNQEMFLALDVEGQTEQEKANIRERFRQQELGLSQSHNKALANKIIAGFSQAFQAVTGLMGANINNRIQAEQTAYDKSIQGIDREKDAKLLTDKEYTQKKKEIDAKHKEEERKLKKEQFELNKAEQLANATMSLATALIAASKEWWMIPIISAFGAIQIGTILSTQAPAYEEGGMLSSKSNKVFDAGPGFMARVGEKGDEFIVPNWQLRDPVVANLVEYIDTRRVNRVTGFEEGGLTSQKSVGSMQSPNNQPLIIQNDNEKLINTLDKLSSKLDNLEARIMFTHDHAYEISKLNSQNQQSQKSAFQ